MQASPSRIIPDKFQRVPFASMLLHGATAVPLSMVGTCIGLYLMAFYVKTIGLDPRYVSAALVCGSLWDAISDQLMGQISDRTSWRFGRRRPWLLLGILPFGLSFYMIMAPPANLAGVELFLYLLMFRLVLFTGSTMIYVPLYALAPEMAQTYHERTRLTAYREALSNVGDLLGMLAPILMINIAVASLGAGTVAERHGYEAVGWLGLVATILFVVGGFVGSYEDPSFTAAQSVDWRAGLRTMRDNRAFRTLILATMFPAMAIQIVATLFLFVIGDVLGIPAETSRGQAIRGLAFLLYVVGGITSYPVWVHVAHRWSKSLCYRMAICLLGASYVGVYLLHEGTLWRLFPIMAMAGAGNAGFWTGMFSQLADIADFDELETGARREGLFAGFAALLRKLGYAIGGAVPGLGLWAFGYQEGPDAVQSATAVLGIKVTFSIPTVLMALLGLYLFRSYPITEAAHAEVLRQLAERRTQDS